MKLVLPYGRNQVEVNIPDNNYLFTAKPSGQIIPAEDEGKEIREALANPIHSEPLNKIAEKVKADEKVVIITSDYTRPTPSRRIIPYILEELKKGGIDSSQVQILFASGLHRVMTQEEMIDILGQELSNKITMSCHDAYNDEFVFMGFSKNNTPIEINKIVADAKLKISISTIEPHHAAGWSGGGKNIIPGVASKDTIFAHHKQMLSQGVGIGIFDGNPFREDIEDIAISVNVDFICNVILSEDKRISKVFCGDVVKAHREGARVCEKLISVELPQLADIIIASPGGAPRDNNLWQTEGKALTRIKDAVKPGGIVIIVSECSEGVGQDEFKNEIETYLAEGDFERALEKIRELSFSPLTNKIARIAKLLQRCNLYFVTSDNMKNMFTKAPFYFFSTPQEALESAFRNLGPECKVLVVPETPSVVLKAPKFI
ncbi:MAG: nickel-dependent lactate racemase [Peptococcaceae bacterium]